jgi:hypothetical protein
LVLLTDLIIPHGGKLLCQLLGLFIWIALIGLDDFLELQGLDTAILPGFWRGRGMDFASGALA